MNPSGAGLIVVTGAAAGGAVRRFVGSGAGTSVETVAMVIVAGPRTYANISLTHSLTHLQERKEDRTHSCRTLRFPENKTVYSFL